MSNRWLVVLVAASLALNVAVVAGFLLLRPRHGCPPPHLRGMKPDEAREFAELREQFDPKMDSLREELRAARGRLYALAADSVPEQAAESLLQAIGSIRVEMNRLAYQHLREVMAASTPERRAEILQVLQAGPMHWRGGPHGRQRRGQGPPPEFDDR